MYTHTHVSRLPIKSRAEEITSHIDRISRKLLFYVTVTVTSEEFPPTPSSSGYTAIPSFRPFTFIFFTPEYGRCAYRNIHL